MGIGVKLIPKPQPPIPKNGGIKMPKIKTHRGAAKRFKVTGSGKIKRSKANKSHILTHKPAKRMRNLRHASTVDKTEEKNIKRLLPYM